MKKSELEAARSEVNVKDLAFRNLQRISREWLGIVLIADEIGEMASLDEAIQTSKRVAQEAEARLSALTTEVSAAQADRDRAQSNHAADMELYRSETAAAQQRLGELTNEIAEVVPAAQREAARLMASAEASAEAIVRVAHAAADKARQEADKVRQEAVEQGRAEGRMLVEQSRRDARDKQAELKELTAYCAQERTRLDEIRAAIARIAAQ
jgi:hypothetical protein